MAFLEDLDYSNEYADLEFDNFYDMPYDDIEHEYFSPHYTSYTLRDLWEDCLIPTCSDGFSAIFNILMCCLLLRFTCFLDFLPKFIPHVTSGCTGIFCLYKLFGSDTLYILIFAIIGYFSVFIIHAFLGKHRGVITAVICFIFLIVCELFIVEQTAWHKVRGSQMILGMKLMSLAFDIDNGDLNFPNFYECFGYLFSVGTVIFGPWVSFSTYLLMLQHRGESILWAVRVILSSVLSFGFLTLSTCWCAWFFQSTSWKWIGAYRDALSFRSSHYFVSYISEALVIASGISATSAAWSFPVVHPYDIELPRSLVEVVICWNLPMHSWLKNYVFKTAKPLGNFIAVLLTYAASSLLHGLNFQLAAVLLSLGFYTYIEFVLRKRLAALFSACILPRKCKNDCDHEFKQQHPYVTAVNLGFGLLAMFHLAYLGVMFDSSSSDQEMGYNMKHTLKKWSELDYASHWVALVTYIFYIMI